jgi:hypothetical protein
MPRLHEIFRSAGLIAETAGDMENPPSVGRRGRTRAARLCRLVDCLFTSWVAGSSRPRVLVDLTLRELSERLVGLLFLGERCLQKLHGLI